MSRTPAVAVLWDMDGTLVDTEPYWQAAERELVLAHGGRWSHEEALQLVGNALLDSAIYLRDHAGVSATPGEIVEHLISRVVGDVERHVPWRPGALELLADLRAHSVPCALVTMSYRRLAQPVLAALPKRSFDVVVTGDETVQGKPHPEPYRTAARLLGVAPGSAVALEDSPAGAASAEAAGCTVVVVPHQVAVPPGPRRIQVDSLDQLSWQTLPRPLSEESLSDRDRT